MRTQALCCEPGCGKPAEFVVYDESTCACDHYQRETHACSAHVGGLIGHSGEPSAKGEKWGVYPIAPDTEIGLVGPPEKLARQIASLR